jgi:hypothetical protein
MSGWVVLVVGAVLCFLGVGSVHLAGPGVGFSVSAGVLGDLFGATALIVAACTAVIAWVLVTLVFKFAGAGPDHQLAGLHLARQPGLPGAPAGWSPTSHQHHDPGGTGRRRLDQCAATKALNLKGSVAAKYICRSAW